MVGLELARRRVHFWPGGHGVGQRHPRLRTRHRQRSLRVESRDEAMASGRAAADRLDPGRGRTGQ